MTATSTGTRFGRLAHSARRAATARPIAKLAAELAAKAPARVRYEPARAPIANVHGDGVHVTQLGSLPNHRVVAIPLAEPHPGSLAGGGLPVMHSLRTAMFQAVEYGFQIDHHNYVRWWGWQPKGVWPDLKVSIGLRRARMNTHKIEILIRRLHLWIESGSVDTFTRNALVELWESIRTFREDIAQNLGEP